LVGLSKLPIFYQVTVLGERDEEEKEDEEDGSGGVFVCQKKLVENLASLRLGNFLPSPLYTRYNGA
jgi:hypothetical protein